MSLIRANALDPMKKRAFYAQLVPARVWDHIAQVDPARFSGGPTNPETLRVIAPADRAEMHLRVPAERHEGDYCLSLDLEEAGAGQLELSFIIINNLVWPRFNIDVDHQGHVTLLGTAGRNVKEEVRALRAGLGPCQVRHGLGLFGDLMPLLEQLAKGLGYVSIVLEPLTYHNAIMYENYGFAYITGYKRMKQINSEFQHGRGMWRLLNNCSPFRDPELALSARGRSWAIHDGVLADFDGKEHLDLQMVKVVGHDANQRTFSIAGGIGF